MESSSPEVKRIVSLDLLRFLAAIFVVFGHIHVECIKITSMIGQWFFFGMRSVGMTFFFILSGFVISINYPILGKKGIGLKRYFIHRISRIYPLFILIFLYEMLYVGNFPRETTVLDVFTFFCSYVTLTHAWFYSEFAHTIFSIFIFGVSWSLSVEFFFYLVYPFIQKVLEKLKIKNYKHFLSVFTLLLGITLFIYYQMSLPQVKSEGIDFDSSEIRWFVYFSPYLSVLEFIMGCLIGRIYLSAPKEWTYIESRFKNYFLSASLISVLLIHVIVIYRIHPQPYTQYEAFYVLSRGLGPFCAYIIFYVARYIDLSKRANTIILLGDLSYPIYLIHWTFLGKMFGLREFNSWITYGFTIIFMFSFLIFFAYGLLKLYDIPVRTGFKRCLIKWFCPSHTPL